MRTCRYPVWLAVAVQALVLGAGAVHAETVLSLTQMAYDKNDRPVCSTVRMNLATTATDACALGNPDTVNNWGQDRITRTVYDADGNVAEIKRAAGTTAEQLYATYTYTQNGQKASEADANGNVTRLVYDGFDRLQAIYYPSPSVTHTASPCAATAETWCGGTQPYTGRVANTASKPFLGVASTTDYETFGYDGNGNKTSWRRRNGQSKYYGYDALNRVVHENGTTGPDIYTSYDLQGHVCDKIFTTDTASSGNDCTARMTAVTTAGLHNRYDKAGRLLATKDGNGRTLSYSYNEASQRLTMTFPDSVVQGYQYNVDGSLKWVGVNATTLGLTPGYDARSRLISVTRSNGANSTVAYDDLNRITSLKHTVTNTAYNADWAFVYNPASQVVKNTAPAVYEYTETGNITDGRTYDGLNRDAGIAAVSGGYDQNGNLTNEGTGGRAFTYDIDNRLLTAMGGPANVTLSYDPMGRLSSYTAGTLTTQFLYDGTSLVAEYQGGTMVKRYMHTLGTDQPFMEFAGAGTAAANARFLLANYQGSIIALADSIGTVNAADVYKYGPYGEPVNASGTATWGGERFRYTGQTVLPEAQLYYYKARVYDPKYGRFLQTDPVGSKDDLDLYAYVGGDPINHSDPTGLVSSCVTRPNGGTTCQTDVTAGGIQRVGATIVAGLAAVGSAATHLYEAVTGKSDTKAVAVSDSSEEQKGNYVYRALSKTDNPAAGIVARNPASSGTPAQHINGLKDSPWISTTKSMAIALEKYNTKENNGVIQIDLNKLPTQVVDASGGLPGASARVNSYAIHDQEVLVRGYIPPSAITAVQTFGGE